MIRPSENPRATENSHDGCQKQKYVRHEAQSHVPLFDTPSPMVLPRCSSMFVVSQFVLRVEHAQDGGGDGDDDLEYKFPIDAFHSD